MSNRTFAQQDITDTRIFLCYLLSMVPFMTWFITIFSFPTPRINPGSKISLNESDEHFADCAHIMMQKMFQVRNGIFQFNSCPTYEIKCTSPSWNNYMMKLRNSPEGVTARRCYSQPTVCTRALKIYQTTMNKLWISIKNYTYINQVINMKEDQIFFIKDFLIISYDFSFYW